MVKQKDNPKDIAEVTSKINSKLKDSGVTFLSGQKIEDGTYQFIVDLNKQKVDQLFYSDKEKVRGLIKERKVETGSLLEKLNLERESENLKRKLENAYLKDVINSKGKAVAKLETRYRDQLSNSYLDLREASAETVDAVKLYERSQAEYYRTGIYGTSVDLLSNFAATGYYNEITDTEIKEFYDSWVKDTDFINVVKRIFHSLFKYSVCYILRGYSSYEPNSDGISSIPGKAPSTKTKQGVKANVANILNEFIKKTTGKPMDFNIYSTVYNKEIGASGSYPVIFSILDPKYCSVISSGFSGKETVSISSKGLANIKKLMETIEKKPETVDKATKDSLKLLPKKMLDAAKKGEAYTFTSDEISVIYLRKDDYEQYAKPRGARAFDAFDYKDELKKADFATIDGIYNFILKVTVGDKDNPVTDISVLEGIADAFNTPQKAFTIVWNHTLQIEKITANEVGNILGKAKYEPVNDDITAALGIARAIIDGGTLSSDAAKLAAKSLQSEINAARQQVEPWIYFIYRVIAKSANFTTYPVVRWKESVINTDSDAVTRNSFMTMLDRKAISFQTWMRENGLDYDTEIQRMREELPLINEGVLKVGSPFQQSRTSTTMPSGDSGRPTGQPTGEKAPSNPIETVKQKQKVPKATQQSENTAAPKEILESLLGELLKLDDETKASIITELTLDFYNKNEEIKEQDSPKKKRKKKD